MAETKQTTTNTDEQIFSITVPKATITESPLFNQVLSQIPKLNAKARSLQEKDINELDDDEVTELTREMNDLSKYDKKFKEVEKAIRKKFNEPRDLIVNEYKERLEKAGFDEFEQNIKKNKQLKRDILANRANKRWAELKTTFDATLQAYPIIQEMAPDLTDFNKFRVRHLKLISGAKTRKVNDKTRSVVTNELYQYSQNLTEIKRNSNELLPPYQKMILNAFINEPTSDNLMAQFSVIKQKQTADLKAQELAKKQAEEAKKHQEELAKQRQNQPTAQPKPQPIVNHTPVQSNIPNYTWLTNYIYSLPKARDIHNNDVAKAFVLHDLYTNITNRNSVWYKNIGPSSRKLIAITRYILDL